MTRILVLLGVEIGDPIVQILSRKLWDIRVIAADPGGLDELLGPESFDAERRADLRIPDALVLVERASYQCGGLEDVQIEFVGILSHVSRQHVSCENQWEFIGISYERVSDTGQLHQNCPHPVEAVLRRNGGWQLDFAMWKRRLS